MTSLYQVEVSIRGQVIRVRLVEAPDSLTAINLVEAEYGEPPEVEYKTIHHENGAKEQLLVVLGWHGYCFLAREAKTIR